MSRGFPGVSNLVSGLRPEALPGSGPEVGNPRTVYAMLPYSLDCRAVGQGVFRKSVSIMSLCMGLPIQPAKMLIRSIQDPIAPAEPDPGFTAQLTASGLVGTSDMCCPLCPKEEELRLEAVQQSSALGDEL